ncbi:MAG: pilus assembly protein PilP [Methylophilaceae bacterium]
MFLSRARFNLLVLAFLSCLLLGCGAGEGDDLDQFMANAATGMKKSVPPLPEVLPYTPLQYNVDAALINPFKARKSGAGSGSLQPNTNRPREALESFPLESLLYVGSLSKKRAKYALVKTPDGTLQQVRVGNYLGPNFGIITAINDTAIEIKEIAQDDITGDWVEREASINLQE